MLKTRFVWLFGAALLILVSILLVTFALNRFFPPFQVSIDTSRTAVVKQMRSLARLETAVFTIEKVIDGGTTGGNIFQRLLFGDKILLIAHGQVIAGFDLSQISEKDITIEEKNVTVKLPAPTILVSTLDNSQTKVYDRQRGLLNDDDTLESQVRQAAEASIRDAACESGILQQASDNGRKQLTALFTSLGFETITFEIPQGSC